MQTWSNPAKPRARNAKLVGTTEPGVAQSALDLAQGRRRRADDARLAALALALALVTPFGHALVLVRGPLELASVEVPRPQRHVGHPLAPASLDVGAVVQGALERGALDGVPAAEVGAPRAEAPVAQRFGDAGPGLVGLGPGALVELELRLGLGPGARGGRADVVHQQQPRRAGAGGWRGVRGQAPLLRVLRVGVVARVAAPRVGRP
eukprot:2123580-Prymnesium_polylepis.1